MTFEITRTAVTASSRRLSTTWSIISPHETFHPERNRGWHRFAVSRRHLDEMIDWGSWPHNGRVKVKPYDYFVIIKIKEANDAVEFKLRFHSEIRALSAEHTAYLVQKFAPYLRTTRRI